ncbi:transcriptional regulator [Salmonella enterica subsp. enterica serovar Paratyphi B]|nr:transcriptional regulator [Salmonella enterica subsp. enterica serovar Paratyphi B]
MSKLAASPCGSLTRAAEVLHISQPAASKALKHAEH